MNAAPTREHVMSNHLMFQTSCQDQGPPPSVIVYRTKSTLMNEVAQKAIVKIKTFLLFLIYASGF